MSDIKSVLKEERQFNPPPEFAKNANVNAEKLAALRQEAKADPEAFWARLAREELVWEEDFTETLDWQPPYAKWFKGGKLNMSVQCLDQHLDGPRKNKAALIWEGEPGEQRTLTYQQLYNEVCRLAHGLERLGVGAGDRVVVYMPMVPELAIALLACARIGALHNVVFGGYSASAIRDRVEDAKAKVILTADAGYRRGRVLPLKDKVDEAMRTGCPTVEKVIVYKRTGTDVNWFTGRDIWWHDVITGQPTDHKAQAFDAEHPLFLLYTSGTTGTPKGVVHATAGYALWTKVTARWLFDLKEEDTYWCTADIGWITGHSYTLYGILQNGATTLMYEGAPDYPRPDRFWDIVERHRVNIFYTAPTAIRAFMKWGEEWPERHDLSSLRLLGSVGEPINPEAWMWYHRVIGQERCPIIDTWWQTETGGVLISPVPGAMPTKPGSATLPLPGIEAAIFDKEGNEVGPNQGGFLVVTRPWPSMLRTVYGNEVRFQKGYFGQFEGIYYAGDGARRDEDGYFWIMGRLDDVINVSGHRLGTMEIESALVSHPKVTEAAVVARPDDLTGQAIVAFVTLGDHKPSDELATELRRHVAQEIGALARPAEVIFTSALPKTRSGKIMRRLLSDVAAGRQSGDMSTLEDASVLDRLRQDLSK